MPTSFTARVIEAARYGLVEMIADLAPWLAVGFVLAGLAGAAIPDGFLQQYVGGGITAMLVMLLVGLPMYVCLTSSTPIAAALIARGLSPGAALVFLLAGPATNLATMLVVGKDLGRAGLTIYVLTIASLAVVFGLIVDAIAPTLPAALTVVPHCTGEYNVSVLWPFAAVFVLLIFNGLRIRLRGPVANKTATG